MSEQNKQSSPAGKPRALSFCPASFSDDLPDLSLMSLEEVVSMFKDTERKRNQRTEPDNEAEVRWLARATPIELVSSLRLVAGDLGVSVSVLTRCMSRQLADWYANRLDVANLSDSYTRIYRQIKRRSYTTLRIQAENPASFSYAHQPEQGRVSFSTIRWIVGVLSELHTVLGIKSIDLFMIGMVWSLTTLANKDIDASNIDRYFLPEVHSMEIMLKDRAVDIEALNRKYLIREEYRSRSTKSSTTTNTPSNIITNTNTNTIPTADTAEND